MTLACFHKATSAFLHKGFQILLVILFIIASAYSNSLFVQQNESIIIFGLIGIFVVEALVYYFFSIAHSITVTTEGIQAGPITIQKDNIVRLWIVAQNFGRLGNFGSNIGAGFRVNRNYKLYITLKDGSSYIFSLVDYGPMKEIINAFHKFSYAVNYGLGINPLDEFFGKDGKLFSDTPPKTNYKTLFINTVIVVTLVVVVFVLIAVFYRE